MGADVRGRTLVWVPMWGVGHLMLIMCSTSEVTRFKKKKKGGGSSVPLLGLPASVSRAPVIQVFYSALLKLTFYCAYKSY